MKPICYMILCALCASTALAGNPFESPKTPRNPYFQKDPYNVLNNPYGPYRNPYAYDHNPFNPFPDNYVEDCDQ